MEKLLTLFVRVNTKRKKDAYAVLSKLGISMSEAINLFFEQIVSTGDICFLSNYHKPPKNVDISRMSDEELYEKLMSGLNDIKEGKTMGAKEALKEFRRAHAIK